MKNLYWILFILFAVLFFLNKFKKTSNDPFESNINVEIFKALNDTTKAKNGLGDNSSNIKIMEDGKRFSEKQIQYYMKINPDGKTLDYVAYWSFDKNKPVTASAFGTDYLHHFVNNYLVGYEPFKTEQLWIPHYTIAMRLKYQLDADQYGGLKEVWQNSKQAFFNTRGDCEDHAIILADWLISMGLDARVVLGKFDNGGHAWVVVFKDSKVFLLEATSKQKRKQWNLYPLADFQTKYHPKCMFNRDYFWLNIGSIYTTRYIGNHWVKKSKFFRTRNKDS